MAPLLKDGVQLALVYGLYWVLRKQFFDETVLVDRRWEYICVSFQ